MLRPPDEKPKPLYLDPIAPIKIDIRERMKTFWKKYEFKPKEKHSKTLRNKRGKIIRAESDVSLSIDEYDEFGFKLVTAEDRE